MPQRMPSEVRYAFGPFLLDPVERTLTREGRPVRLTPKDVGVLLALVERHGALVDREQLFARVWPGVIVEDCNLARHVATLRQALGDLADAPTYIETLPKRGYRFVAPVTTRPADEVPRGPAPVAAVPAEPAAAQAVPSAPDARPAAGGAPGAAGPPEPPAPRAAARGRAWLTAALPRLLAGLGGLTLVLVSGWLNSGDPARAAGPIRSLAILPVANLTGDPRHDHVAEALGEMMVNDLGRRRELQVVSRGSARRFSGSPLSARAIGRDLEVDGLLESAVIRADDRVRITAELVDTRSERLVWAEVFEGDACDFMELQDLVAEAVAEALGLGPDERPSPGLARSPHPAVQGLTCSASGGGAP